MGMDRVLDPAYSSFQEDSCNNEYTRDDGLLILPLASSSSAPKVIRVHAPINFRTVRFKVDKLGAPPMFPSFTDPASGRDKFLGAAITFDRPKISTDQSHQRFIIEGTYFFAETAESPRGSSTSSITDMFHTGRPSFPIPGVNELLDKAVLAGHFNNFGEPISLSFFADRRCLFEYPGQHISSIFMANDLIR